MNKKLIVLVFLISILFLSSCSLGGLRTGLLTIESDGKRADTQLENIIEAIKNNDKNSLKTKFSESALKDSIDFDEKFDCLVDFIEGEIIMWEGLGSTVSDSISDGIKKKEVRSYYYVITNKQKYFFLLHDHPVDTENTENVGLYMLLVIKVEDEEYFWDNKNKIECAGIALFKAE